MLLFTLVIIQVLLYFISYIGEIKVRFFPIFIEVDFVKLLRPVSEFVHENR